MAVKPLQSVETTLRVLEGIAGAQPVGVSALARLLELDKNAVQRSLVTLGANGWIRQISGESGAWELTSKAFRIGARYAPGLTTLVRSHLEELQRETGETALVFARDGELMVVVDAIDSTQPLRLTVPVGTTVPLRRSGTFDAFLSDAERADLDEVARPGAASVATVRRLGYFVLEEVYPSAIAVGAPVYDTGRGAVGAILVVAPRQRFSKVEQRRVGELVRTHATAVSNLG